MHQLGFFSTHRDDHAIWIISNNLDLVFAAIAILDSQRITDGIDKIKHGDFGFDFIAHTNGLGMDRTFYFVDQLGLFVQLLSQMLVLFLNRLANHTKKFRQSFSPAVVLDKLLKVIDMLIQHRAGCLEVFGSRDLDDSGHGCIRGGHTRQNIADVVDQTGRQFNHSRLMGGL